MKINYRTNTIELTKSEAKQAEIYGSVMYKALLDAKKDFPSFDIVVKSPAKRDNYKGLTTKFMADYIAAHDDDEHSIMAEFNTLRGLDGNGNKKQFAAVASYGELRMWFLNKYPQLRDMQGAIGDIMKKVREDRAAA